jgi:hypothetical protein
MSPVLSSTQLKKDFLSINKENILNIINKGRSNIPSETKLKYTNKNLNLISPKNDKVSDHKNNMLYHSSVGSTTKKLQELLNTCSGNIKSKINV